MEVFLHAGRADGVDGPAQRGEQTIDNPLVVNKVLSFLIYGTTRRR
jgi:hypothetical protein